jgi:hypothetical protein
MTRILGTVPAGKEWIVVAAETNLRRGSAVGGPTAELSDPEGLLTMTGTCSTPHVSNNNSTGSYTATGTAPWDPTDHVHWPATVVLPAGSVVKLETDALVGDSTITTFVAFERRSATSSVPAGASSPLPGVVQPATPGAVTGGIAPLTEAQRLESLTRWESELRGRESAVTKQAADLEAIAHNLDRARKLNATAPKPKPAPKDVVGRFRAWAKL